MCEVTETLQAVAGVRFYHKGFLLMKGDLFFCGAIAIKTVHSSFRMLVKCEELQLSRRSGRLALGPDSLRRCVGVSC